jgi:hypothetical protein
VTRLGYFLSFGLLLKAEYDFFEKIRKPQNGQPSALSTFSPEKAVFKNDLL